MFEDALAGVAAGRAAASPAWSGSTGSGRPTRCASTAPTSSSRDLAELLDAVIDHPAFTVEPWALRETELDLDVLAQSGVDVRARQRPHRPARQPRRGRAGRPARHLPERLLRGAPAALRRGRLRLPRGRSDGRQRHQRQDHPPAGRRRAASTSASASCAATSGCSTFAPASCDGAASGSRRPAGACWCPPSGWSRSRSGRSPPFSTRSSRSTIRPGWSCSRSSWPTSRCRTASSTRVPRHSWARCCARSSSHDRDAERRARALDQHERAADGRRHGSHRRAVRPAPRRSGREQRGPRARDDHRRRRARGSGCAWSSSSPTAGRVGARQRRCATRSRPRWPRRATPAGTGCSPPSATTSTTSGSAPTSSSTATPSCSRRSASRCSTPCRRAPEPSGARSPPRA